MKSETKNAPGADPAQSPAAQAYQVIGMAAVVVLGAALFQRGADRWALVPVLIGASGLAFRWRTAPPALLAGVAFAILAPAWVGPTFAFRRAPSVVTDLLLSLGLVAYVLAQYRLLSLTVGVLPPDPLRPKEKRLARPAGAFMGREIATGLITAVGATLAAVFLWEITDIARPPWGVPARNWRVGQVIWLFAAGLLVLFAAIGYLGWRRMTSDEAQLILRDALWAETRREQRRIQRWTAWARAKAGR